VDTARKTDNKHQYLTVIVLASFLAVIISLFLLSRSSIETADYTERVKSKALLERAFDHELHTINQTLLDYAFWDDAVRQILINENDAWLAENFEHTYLQNNFGFNVVGLLDDMDEPKFLYLDGVEISQFKESQAFQAFSVLAHHARTQGPALPRWCRTTLFGQAGFNGTDSRSSTRAGFRAQDRSGLPQ
jgi:sensor domain CHASE-containing protein